jgi:uncharacterized membrane protein YkvI
MFNLEESCKKIFSSSKALYKLSVACLLFFLPFSYGYLYRYVLQIRVSQNFDLPEWNDWGGLFFDGLRLLVVVFLFFLAPLILALCLSSVLMPLLEIIGLKILSYIPFRLILLSAPAFTGAALYEYQTDFRFKTLFNFKSIFSRVLAMWEKCLIPSLAFVGFLTLTAPVYPISFFLGLFVMVPFYTLSFLDKETK